MDDLVNDLSIITKILEEPKIERPKLTKQLSFRAEKVFFFFWNNEVFKRIILKYFRLLIQMIFTIK